MASGTYRRRGHRNSSSHKKFNCNGDAKNNNDKNCQFYSNDHLKKMLGNLNNLRSQIKFCDVELLVENEVFHCHRAVMAASSPYFEAMFGSELAEKQQSKIEIHGIAPWVFNLLIGFIYSGEVKITQENVQELLAASNMLELSEIISACCDFLRKELHPTNSIGIYRFAELHACTNLRLESKRFIERHFTEVILEDEFYDIPKDTLKNFLKSEGLSIDNEYQVFRATMNWILHDVTQRRRYIFELLESIRLPVISQKQLDAYVKECPDLSLKVALMKSLQDYKNEMRVLQLEWRLGNMYDVRTQPRMCARKSIYVIGGYNRSIGRRWTESKTLVTVERLDTYKRVWKPLQHMKFSRSGHGVVVLNSLIYVVGGESDCMILDHGEVYDPISNEWSMISSMNQPRCVLGACAVDGYMFVFGGWVGAEIGNTIERYDPVENKWITVSEKMTTARYAMGVISYQGIIYIAGGLSELSTELDLVESYNPVTGEWTCLCPLKNRRAHVGLAVLHDHIYAVGGTNSYHEALRSVERYSVDENKWTEIPPMKTSRAGACVTTLNGKLIVIGGRTLCEDNAAPITLDTIEIYDPETNTWTEGLPMPTSRCEAAVAVL